MNNLMQRRGFVLLVLTVFMLSVVSHSMADTITFTEAKKDEIINVNKTYQDEESIEWEVTFNQLSIENEGSTIELHLSEGLSKSSIDANGEVDIDEIADGYRVSTPAGNEIYTFKLATIVNEQEEAVHELKAKVTVEDEQYEVSEQVNAIEKPKEEETEANISEDVVEESNQSVNESIEDVKEIESNEKEVATENNESIEGDSNYQTRNNSYRTTDIPIPEWPGEGALNLNKVATPTGEYGEWEIQLTVEGKDLKRSSDIVLVLDISSSMSKNKRFPNMLKAAEHLVETVMTGNPNTRISLVEYDEKPNLRLDFSNDKTEVINSIRTMKMGSGTNIQGGIYEGRKQLEKSEANQKTMVLLTDGSANRSYRAASAEPYTGWSWPDGKYDFALKDFDYTRIRSSQDYRVDGYRVKDHYIGTISEAKLVMDQGFDMYSIGLEVSSSNAINTMIDSQNKGYYPSTSDELESVFKTIAADLIKKAGKFAVAIDPIGDMYNLVKKSYDGKNFKISHGTVDWNDEKETIIWEIGDIDESELYTLKYKVTIDWDKNPKGNQPYDTNGETYLNYVDPNGNPQKKNFPIPNGQIERGKIIKKGYSVNVNGEPIDSNGNVVSDPKDAEQFYEEYHEDPNQEGVDNKPDELKFFEIYQVEAKEVDGYKVHNFDEQVDVYLDIDNPIETVWFPYVKKAGDITVLYQDEEGNELASPEKLTGVVGQEYETELKEIPGYEFKEMHPDSAPASGVFKNEEQTVIYVYQKKLGSISIAKVDEEGKPLEGAEFTLTGENGFELVKTSDSNGEISFDGLEWGEYKLRETKAPEGYRLQTKGYDFVIDAENLEVELEIKNTRVGWELPSSGGIGTLVFYLLGIALMASTIFNFRRRRINE